jgi:hypothetical protein
MTGRAVFIGDTEGWGRNTSAGGVAVIGAGLAVAATTGALGTPGVCAEAGLVLDLRGEALHLT